MAQGVAGVLDPTGSWVVLVLSPRGIFSSQASSLSSAEDPAGGKKAANRSGVEQLLADESKEGIRGSFSGSHSTP